MRIIPNPAAPAATAASPAPGRSYSVIRAEGKLPLGTDAVRHRGVGRIGGLVGYADPAALSRLAHALGADAQILREQPSLALQACMPRPNKPESPGEGFELFL